MADLAKKRKIRAGHKGSVTRTINKVDTALTAEPVDVAALPLLKLTLKEKVEVIRTLDAEVIELIEDEDALTAEIQQADEYRESIHSYLLRIEAALEKATTATPPTTGATPTAAAATPTTATVKLPRLKLRAFAGELTQWTPFWESFEVAVHTNASLTPVEKFNYLTSVLEGTARQAIGGLSLTAANYEQAVATLKKRFGSKQKIINKHMDAMLKIGSVSSCSDMRGLRHLFDQVSSHIRSLKSLDVGSDTYGGLLCPVLVARLPPELQLIVSRNISEDDWNLDEILRVVEEELVARERVTLSQAVKPKRESKPPPSATTLVSDTKGINEGCCYCGKDHFPTSCDVVSEVDARKQVLRKSGRCFSCLRRGHLSRNCRTTRRCHTCNGRHHTSICAPRQPKTTDTQSEATPLETTSSLNPSAPEFTPSATGTTLYFETTKTVLLQTAVAGVYNPTDHSQRRRIRVVLDSGSQRSYLTERMKQDLRLEAVSTQLLSIATFGSKRAQAKPCDVVTLGILTRSGPDLKVNFFVVPHICDPLSVQPVSTCSEWDISLSNLDFADCCDGTEPLEVDLLIGSDVYWDIVTGEIVRGPDGLVAVNTRLGWVLSGPVQTTDVTSVNLTSSHALRTDDSTEMLDEKLQSFWELESLGIKLREDPVHEQFVEDIRMEEGRYQVSLPWRRYHEPLPTNHELSLKRLRGLLRRLKQDPDVLAEYDKTIREQLAMGVIERVEPGDVGEPGKVHYLPHHAVIRRDKETTKVRVVYDASSRSEGPSLNNCLHTGPKFNQKILELLLRFRTYPVAVVADIEKAFLMISVNPQDRDVLRFLWVKDIQAEELEIVTFKFARVVFGVSSSPFLLNATIQHHVKKYIEVQPVLVNKILESIYVDDVVGGDDTEEQAYQFYKESKGLLKKGSFNLRKFVTNLCSLQGKIEQEELPSRTDPPPSGSTQPLEETYAETLLPSSTTTHHGEQKVLGVHWNVHDDNLIFDFREVATVADALHPTKRNVISVIGRFYDPLGYLSPTIVQFKVYMQELCKSKLSWDESLTGEALSRWTKLVNQLRMGFPLSLPRCSLSAPVDGSMQYRLYGFCDASVMAYAAVIYLAEETVQGTSLSFVVCKTRVAPLKVQTIPRLELLSSLLLTRLLCNVGDSLRNRLPLQSPKCFTDSQVVLYWITGLEKEWKPFVQNRVNEIREGVPISSWSHCPGTLNPADIPSRGITAEELSRSTLWRDGPDLSQFPEGIPLPDDIPEPCVVEMKAHTLIVPSQVGTVSDVIEIERFRTVHKLYRTTAYVLKFIKLMQRKSSSPELLAQDLCEAEQLWIKDCQLKLMSDKNFANWKSQFGLFEDSNEIWRCGGRLQNAKLPFSTVHPILLDRSHPLTKLIVVSAHGRIQHNGVKETLSEVRGKFWVLKGRSLVKQIISKCVVCRRYEGLPFKAPPAPPLPKFRVNEAPPFMYTAVDFAGPLYLRGTNDSEGRKVWICLFTCCVTRAIHLELVNELSTVAFIRCLKKFSARRGLPRKIVSDNAKTFKAAARAIELMLSQPDVKEHLLDLKVEWNFNLEKAPWWGGLFERLVKSTKRCLRKMIGQARLSFDEMHTAVLEVESILNSRPLTYTTSDDLEEPLTPSHLLVGRRLLSFPDDLTYLEDDDPDFELTSESLQRRVRHLNSVINHFWQRWSREYLLELRESHRHQAASKNSPPINVGDVVLLEDRDKPRGFWRLARVEKLLAGKDDKVRGAQIRVSTPTGQSSTLRRPLQALYPLEITQSDVSTGTPEVQAEEVTAPSTGDQTQVRASRGAAIRANENFKRWAAELTEDVDVDR